ncbi:glycoside hydrolase family 5 protein [Auriscalpium vulgare]|uniref:Glycoside hydrolase family 5 protein n=1 Tax=Auriscalpium vulgare TaxID=40419 RepID=A0ACB8RK82_9AGAM|nr:glycoside hydrolase family 5 protein [Auriscalpium vulgare]
MPRIPSVSPATGNPTSPNFIHTIDGNFVDSHGRTLLFRGVNLSGSSKAPVGEPSYILNGFWENAERGGKSFIGRPLNVDDGSADVHLARLRGWGFNFIRYPVAWEALEHAGPGKYDTDFMDYTIRVLRKCKEYGFKVYMDPHQDIWSRFNGGSGAPYWTLLACGMNPRNFTATQASILHNEYPIAHQPDPASVPAMMWSTNYGHLATQTLFTLFFAGRDFAPKCIIDGMNIQDYLQKHYIEAFGQLADRIRDAGDLLEDCVVGWDSMNEPAEGFVGYPDLNSLPDHQTSTLKKGPTPTPAQSLRLGMGQAQTVENWTFNTFGPKQSGTVTVDPKGLTIWADPLMEPEGVHPRYGWTRDPGWRLGEDIWAQHDVWDIETGYVMRPDYFRLLPAEEGASDATQEVSFISDYWAPHWQAWARRMRQAHPEAIHFVAPPVFAPPPPLDEEDLGGRVCYSTHYYDGLTLVTRHWNWFNADALGLLRGKYKSKVQALRVGERAIRKSLQDQLGMLKEDAIILGAYPTIVGEIGIPYDMDGRRAYGWTDGGKHKGDYTYQERALDASLNATDGPNAMSYTIWTYCPDNVHPWGDGWNMEDLSLWSPDDLRPRDGREVYAGNLADKSSALLLAHKRSAMRSRSTFRGITPMGASQLSLATLPVAAALFNDDVRRPEITRTDIWDSEYDFLTDGARAVKSFSRPYPIAVVGIVGDIKFDINKTEFKLTVRVRADDAPISSASSTPLRPSTPASTSSATSEPKIDVPPTEVFLPLVHYAADRAVGSLLAQDTYTQDPSAPGPSAPRTHYRGSSSMETLNPPRVSEDSRAMSAAGMALGGQPLAVDVSVSEGRWELDGTTLRWWYAVPQPGEPDREYTLVVARRGGRIWTKEERDREGVWEQVCGETVQDYCTVM